MSLRAAGANATGAGSLGVAKATSVGAIGDSITANGWPSFDLYNGGSAPTATQINIAYTTGQKLFLLQNYLLHASLRSGGGYFPFEFAGACSGATSQQIMGTASGWAGVSPLDVMLGNPYGLPRMCVVLAGTNDYAAGLTTVQALAALQYGYQRLISAGVIPIAMTIPPNNSTPSALQSWIKQTNAGIVRLAARMQIPCADIYRALVKPSNGQYRLAAYTADGVHPTALAAGIMGDVLNQTIVGWFTSGPPFFTASFDDSTVSTRVRDPKFLAITGTLNTASSYPSDWIAPSTTAMSTMFNASGAEPGGGHTMDRGTPAILGQQPNYLGSTWCLQGDGSHGTGAMLYNLTPFTLPCSVGDKLAMSFRLKFIPASGSPTHVGDFRVCAINSNNGHVLAGIVGPAYNGRNDNCQIGGEPGYDAAYAYFEYTVVSGEGANNFTPMVSLSRSDTTSNSNVGDALCIANFQCVNLAAEGIV